MRKLWIIGGILAACVLAVGALLLLVDVNQFRPTIQAQLEKQLGRQVKLGEMGLKLFPLAIRIDSVEIGEDPAFGTRPFLTSQQMYVRVGLGALLRKQVQVESLRLASPAVELVQNKAGVWNASTLAKSGSTADKSTGSSGSNSFSLGELLIENGSLAITDQRAGKSRAVYDHIDVEVHDFAPGKDVQVKAGVHLPGTGKQRLEFVGKGRPLAGGDASGGDFSGDLTLDEVSTAGLRAFLNTGSGAQDIVVNGKASLASHATTLESQGKFQIQDKRLNRPIELTYTLSEDKPSEVLKVSKLSAQSGSLQLDGNLEAHLKETPMPIRGELRTGKAALGDVLALADALGLVDDIKGSGELSLDVRIAGTSASPDLAGSGTLRNATLQPAALKKPIEISTADLRFGPDTVSIANLTAALGSTHLRGSVDVKNLAKPNIEFKADADKVDTDELSNLVESRKSSAPARKPPSSGGVTTMRGSGTLSARTVMLSSIALNDVSARCNLEAGILKLDPLSAKLFGGEQNGAITVDLRGDSPKVALQTRMANVDTNELLSATTSLKRILFGKLGGDAGIQLNSTAGGPNELVKGLNGNLQFHVNDGKLAGINLLNEASNIAGLLGYAKKTDNFTNLVKLVGSVRIKDGVAETDDLALTLDGASIGAAGKVGLADQTLNLKLTTLLGKEQSQMFGGNKVTGFMSTALSNNKGELVIPAIVSGTFAKPSFAPDPQRIAKMKLEGLMPSKDNPAGVVGAVQGIMGQFRKKPSADAQQPADASPQPPPQTQQGAAKKALGDLLNSLGNKGKKQ